MIVRKQHQRKPAPASEKRSPEPVAQEAQKDPFADVTIRVAYWMIAIGVLIVAGLMSLVVWGVFDEVETWLDGVFVMVVPVGLILTFMLHMKVEENQTPPNENKLGYIVYIICLVGSFNILIGIKFGDITLKEYFTDDWKYYVVISTLFMSVASLLYGLIPNRSEIVGKHDASRSISTFTAPAVLLLGAIIFWLARKNDEVPWLMVVGLITVVFMVWLFVKRLERSGWPDHGLALFITIVFLMASSISLVVVGHVFGLLNAAIGWPVISWFEFTKFDPNGLAANIFALGLTVIAMFTIAEWLAQRVNPASNEKDSGD